MEFPKFTEKSMIIIHLEGYLEICLMNKSRNFDNIIKLPMRDKTISEDIKKAIHNSLDILLTT